MIVAPPFTPESPSADEAAAYAQLLLRLHELAKLGQDEGDEADTLRDQMTTHWYRMSAEEQDRMRWLSADLYTIEEGGAKSTTMLAAEKQDYQERARAAYESGDPDRLLDFLRRPYREGLPPDSVPFLQARAWVRLGNLEVAILFLREAERLNPEHAVFVMHYLHRLGRYPEAERYASRFLDNIESRPEEICLAASVFIERTRSSSDEDSRPTLEMLLPPLRRALQVQQSASRNGTASELSIEALIALMLGLCLERSGRATEAIAVYDEELRRVPRDHELHATLLTMRALVQWPPDTPAALGHFEKAIRAGTTLVWPYYFFAAHLMRQGRYTEVVRLSNFALERLAMPTTVRAELYSWVAIAYAQLGQPAAFVLRSFDLAERLDPSNKTIRENRELYQASPQAKNQAEMKWPSRKASLEMAREAVFARMERHQEHISDRLTERETAFLAPT